MAFTIDATTYRSPNFDSRPPGTAIWSIIIHTCEGKPCGDEQQSSIPWLCNPTSGVSSHFYITRAGIIYQLVDDSKRAWHAGVSMLNGVWYCNNYSLGIELEHRDNCAPFPDIQADALSWLCAEKIARYGIPETGIDTHRTVAANAGRTNRSDPTDWPDADFYAWRSMLYVTDRLKARTLPGIPGAPPVYCSVAAAEYYAARGGLYYCGYPLADQFHDTSLDCDVLRCERVIIKESARYGIEQALLSEARAEGWL